MKITLRQLEVFDAVATAGSVTAAANKLRMSQSAASSALTDLQSILGYPLFAHAKGRLLQITDDGERLRPFVRSLLNGIRDVERNAAAPLEGRLVIGATAMVAETVLPQECVAFLRQYPGVRIFVESLSADELFERLSRFELEVAVIELAPQLADLELVRWRGDELWLVVDPAHALAGRTNLTVRDLTGFSWCLREPQSSQASRLRYLLHDELGSMPIAFESTSNWAVRLAVMAGGGIGCLSRSIVQYDVDHGRLIRLQVADFRLTGALSLAKPKGVRPSRLTAAFEGFLLSRAEPG